MLHQKFKFSPTLSSWHPDKYPYYLASVNDIFKGNNTEMHLAEKRGPCDEIILINKGSATINHFYMRRGEIKTIKVAQNDVVFSPGGTYCEFHDASADLEFTVIHFFLYTCDAISSTKHSLNISDIFSGDISHARVYISIPLVTKLSENKKFNELMNEVLAEFNSKVSGYQIQIQTSLQQMLLILLRNNAPEFDNALCNANLVGITSQYNPNSAMPPNCSLTITDVEILPKKPEPTKKRTPISIYRTTKPSLLSEYEGFVHYETNQSPDSSNSITLSSKNETGYHVWFFPDSEVYTPDLRAYKKNAYIRFFAKSTLPMTFGLVIYNHDNHSCINHNFYIEPSDTLKEFCLPLLQNTVDKKMPAYIYDTLDYIDKNYQSKIKLEEIAISLHLNASYLSKLFKENMGITISEHILSRRLNAAVILLKQHPDKPISDIANETGFYDTAHFSKAFKKAYSETILQYKKRLISNDYKNN